MLGSVAQLAYAADLKSAASGLEGSSPSAPTRTNTALIDRPLQQYANSQAFASFSFFSICWDTSLFDVFKMTAERRTRDTKDKIPPEGTQ